MIPPSSNKLLLPSFLFGSLCVLASGSLYSHHQHWKRCSSEGSVEIVCNNDKHLVWRLQSLVRRNIAESYNNPEQQYSISNFTPTWYLTNPHAQTVFNALFRKPRQVDLQFDIKRTKHTFVDSGATVYLDWITPAVSPHEHQNKTSINNNNNNNNTSSTIIALEPPRKTLFIMPGVVSGTDGIGVLNLVQQAIEKNYRCIVFNYMSKEGLNVMTKDEYPIIPGVTHNIHDLSNILRVVQNELGHDHPLIAVGVSLGANILVQYIGEHSSLITEADLKTNPLFKMINLDAKPKYFKDEKVQSIMNSDEEQQQLQQQHMQQQRHHPFRAVVSIGNPYDLDVATRILEESSIHHYLYDSFFAQKRADMFRVNVLMTSTPESREFDMSLIDKLPQCKTTRQLDEMVSIPMLKRVLKREGRDPEIITNIHDFYNLSSSKNWAAYVDVPLLSINAKDDPISRFDCVPLSAARFNKNLAFVITQTGGHVGWLDTWRPYTTAGYRENFAERVAMEFIDKLD